MYFYTHRWPGSPGQNVQAISETLTQLVRLSMKSEKKLTCHRKSKTTPKSVKNHFYTRKTRNFEPKQHEIYRTFECTFPWKCKNQGNHLHVFCLSIWNTNLPKKRINLLQIPINKIGNKIPMSIFFESYKEPWNHFFISRNEKIRTKLAIKSCMIFFLIPHSAPKGKNIWN